MEPQKIAIIGTGNVGTALGSAWSRRGHQVRYGSRAPDPTKPDETSIAPAVQTADIVVLAVPWAAVGDTITACGPLAGKILVDCTNPLLPQLTGLEVGHSTSGAETIARRCPGASVVKAFNSTGAENLGDASAFAVPPVMLVCGDQAAAKATVLSLARDLGFEAVDAGALSLARVLEPMAMLWIHLAYRQGLGRSFAFTIQRRA